MSELAALVLAGRRRGDDPLAGAGAHPALLEVAGVPMLARVVRTLEAAGVERVTVSIDTPELLAGCPELRDRLGRGALAVHRSLDSPSRSVLDALEGPLADRPVLVTTADHALLRAEWIEAFLDGAEARGADVAVGVVAGAVIRAAHPETRRTVVPLRGGGYSGANLFAFRTGAGRRAARFWVRAEDFRKRPWRLARAFGPASLLLFALRRLSLEAAFERASRVMGCRVRPVPLPFAEAAIDVDRPADLALATRLLEARD